MLLGGGGGGVRVGRGLCVVELQFLKVSGFWGCEMMGCIWVGGDFMMGFLSFYGF